MQYLNAITPGATRDNILTRRYLERTVQPAGKEQGDRTEIEYKDESLKIHEDLMYTGIVSYEGGKYLLYDYDPSSKKLTLTVEPIKSIQ
jgi:hypothetical protein